MMGYRVAVQNTDTANSLYLVEWEAFNCHREV